MYTLTHTYTNTYPNTCIYVAFKFTVSGYDVRVAVYFTLFIEEAAVVCILPEIYHFVFNSKKKNNVVASFD